MASRLFKLLNSNVGSVNLQQIRNFQRMPLNSISPLFERAKPTHLSRSLEERIAELEYKDPEIHYKVNIGMALPKKLEKATVDRFMDEMKQLRNNTNMEREARLNKIVVDPKMARKDWEVTSAPQDLKKIADHYGIYNDLYGDAYFYPVKPIKIDYDFGDEEFLARVYSGNLITSAQAKNAPKVTYDAKPDSLWTLLLTTPDCNFTDPEFEYCHWFIGNIPGNEIEKGEQIIDYMRPIPPRGIGFCRYIFILYKQDKHIDFSEYKKEQPCLELVQRNWKTYDFYRKHQDYMTPVGLSFFQTEYDSSLKDFYHHTLQMELPIFEYDFPKVYVKPQEWFPIKEAFNTYMDRYRDPKEINKEFLLKKLKKTHPFRTPEPPLKYPHAHPHDKGLFSWERVEAKKERLGWGRINDYK